MICFWCHLNDQRHTQTQTHIKNNTLNKITRKTSWSHELPQSRSSRLQGQDASPCFRQSNPSEFMSCTNLKKKGHLGFETCLFHVLIHHMFTPFFIFSQVYWPNKSQAKNNIDNKRPQNTYKMKSKGRATKDWRKTRRWSPWPCRGTWLGQQYWVRVGQTRSPTHRLRRSDDETRETERWELDAM